MDGDVRAQYEALGVEQRAAVDALLASEMTHGWVPKGSDIEAAIALALRATPCASGQPVD